MKAVEIKVFVESLNDKQLGKLIAHANAERDKRNLESERVWRARTTLFSRSGR